MGNDNETKKQSEINNVPVENQEEIQRVIVETIKELPDEDKKILIMHYYDEPVEENNKAKINVGNVPVTQKS